MGRALGCPLVPSSPLGAVGALGVRGVAGDYQRVAAPLAEMLGDERVYSRPIATGSEHKCPLHVEPLASSSNAGGNPSL